VNLSRQRTREVGLWQRRYWEHRIRDADDFRRHVEYTHFNPVKHEHVVRVADWPYSSFHNHVKRGWIEVDWGTVEPDGIFSLDAGE
jgi:putative transposase